MSSKNSILQKIKIFIVNEFEMSDLDEIQYFISMQLKKSSNRIFIAQTKYVEDLLVIFSMKDCTSVTTPKIIGCKLMKEDSTPLFDVTLYKSLVGGLIYLIATRPNIMFVVSLVAIFLHYPR